MTLIAAFDAGTTHTRAGLYDGERNLLAEAAGPGANPIENGIPEAVAVLATLLSQLTKAPADILIAGVSGAGRPALRTNIAQALANETASPRVVVTSDLYPVLYANAPQGEAVLAIAGTGSSVLAIDAEGQSVTVGGRGRVFGDDGSAYQIAVTALRAAAEALDGLGPPTRLLDALHAAVGLASFHDLVPWSASAPKSAIAALSRTVESVAAENDDSAARECIKRQAAALARQCQAAALKLNLLPHAKLFTNGALFEESKLYREAFLNAVAQMKELSPAEMRFRGHRAVLEMAFRGGDLPSWASESRPMPAGQPLPDTEKNTSHERPLDDLNALEIVQRMNAEDALLAGIIAESLPNIAAIVERAAHSIQHHGRIIYAGAGTSGRLGVLDASECPPTFGIDPDRVIALIAGGEMALRCSVEGAEDDASRGARDLDALLPLVNEKDTVIGIAASGSTPYVRGVLEKAATLGATTALVACNPAPAIQADLMVALPTGPEVIPGSTRLKAGTATKMVLNMISTGAMTLSGMVYDGLMIGVRPVNQKLRARAARIVACLTGLTFDEAGICLLKANGRIPVAVLMAKANLDATDAEQLLQSSGGTLRGALENLK